MHSSFLKYFSSTFSLFVAIAAFHSVQAADPVSVRIEQSGRLGVLGTVIISQPNSDSIEVKNSTFASDTLKPGLYSVLIYPPAGTTPKVTFFLDGELQSQNGANISFNLNTGQQADFTIVYDYTRTGIVGVSTMPSGMPYVLRGPDGLEWSGTTPANYKDLPEGQYTATIEPPEGCGLSRPVSDRLLKDGRINFHREFSCEAAYKLSESQKEQNSGIVGRIDGEVITFTDVPDNQWYTPYVAKAIKSSLLAGYTKSTGESTNTFGPNDTVNLAQLSKVAHLLAGINADDARGSLQNTKARGTWFEKFYISAESERWLLFTNVTEDPSRPATRAEVIGTLLQALNRPPVWPRGDIFTDVKVHTKYAAPIEMAAIDGLLDTSKPFRPNDPINRAELAKILVTALELYGQDS
jgi:hypothetical protein